MANCDSHEQVTNRELRPRPGLPPSLSFCPSHVCRCKHVRTVALLVGCLSSGGKALAQTSVCNPNNWKVEAGGLEIRGHPWPYSNSEASLAYMRPSLKQTSGFARTGFGVSFYSVDVGLWIYTMTLACV